QRQVAGIAQLYMIEDIERLHSELQRNMLSKPGFFGERHIHLPRIQGAANSVRGVSVTKEVSVCIRWRRLEGGRIDQRPAPASTVRQRYRHTRNEIGPLVRLIIAIRQQIRERQPCKRSGGNAAAQIHGNSFRMSCMPQTDTTQLPSADDLAQNTMCIGECFSGSEGEFVDGVHSNVVPHVEDAWSLVALQAVDVLRSARFATSHRSVIDRMRPGVTRLKFQTLAEAALQRQPQSVIRA